MKMTVQDYAIKEVLVTEEQISKKIAELGAAITRDYAGKDLLMVSILKGSVMVMADLMRAVDLPLQIDFIQLWFRHRNQRRCKDPKGSGCGH